MDSNKHGHFNGYTDAAWCKFALKNDYWPLWEYIPVVLDTPQAFNNARDLVEKMVRDGWVYDGANGDGEVILCFSKSIPVTDEEREQARTWLEKYNG